jgi:diguanylate cyclase (GGDEF)-like protein
MARDWAAIAAALGGFAVAASVGLMFTQQGGYVAALWPANGLLCAMLLRFVPARNHALTLTLAAPVLLGVNMAFRTPLGLSSAFALIDVLEVAFAVRFVRGASKGYPDFADVAFLMRFVVHVGLLIPLAGATAATLAVVTLSGTVVSPVFVNWFLSEAIGFLVGVPALSLIWGREPLNTFNRSRYEVGSLFALLVIAAVGVFAQTTYSMMFVLMPVLLLLAYRLGPPMAGLATLLSIIAVAFTLQGAGPGMLATWSLPGSHIHLVQIFMVFAFFTSLPVASTVIEQMRLEADLVEKERQASQANAELRWNNATLEREIAERKRAELETAQMCERLDAAIEHMSQGLCMYDGRGDVIVSNERFASMYGLSLDDVRPGVTRRQVVEARIRAGNIPVGEVAAYLSDHTDTVTEPSDTVYELSDGRVIAVARRPMSGGGWVATHEDITERRRIESRLVHLALHDGLTDLPNRAMFRRRLEQALGRVRRGEQLAVHFLDLDQFKCLNDTLGHDVGDELLRSVAKRLQECVRSIDTVARMGGDEFAILQVQLGDCSDATAMAQRLIDELALPHALSAHQVSAPASIGITISPDDGMNPDDLLKQADLALYKAKADGRGMYMLFEPEMDARMKGRRQLEVDLRHGVQDGEFEVFYQPIHDVQTGEIASLEALLRWRHPVRGMVSPAEFIPVAEEIGLIGALGEFVLERACAAAKKFPDNTKVAINLSAAQFYDIGLAQKIAATLDACGLDPSRLEVEITESLLLRDDQHTVMTLHELRALGVSIALDDFGTGYSSLSYLQRFPFDKIKIDRSFIKDVTAEGESLTLLRAITGLAYALGIRTTAEGIETEQQLTCVRSVGCSEVQGFLLCKPLPEHELEPVFAQTPRDSDSAAA